MSNLKVENSFDSLVSATPSNAHNEWENDFIQSVETPYGASIYRERADMLIKEVKIMFREIGKGDGDLIDRLEMVDAIQCLGIYRYFENEIKEALDYVYRCWNGKVGIGSGSESISSDLYVTSLGFRALRLHRYHVSADVMENFKNKNDEFLCCNSTGEEYVMKSLLFLLRASGVSFPGETVMEEAKVFCTAYFNKILAKHGATHISGYPERLIKEVKYTLVYDWRRTFCRWEARNYIEIYGQDNARFLSRLNGEKLLELGKLEFNILQSVHQNEMKALSRWWIDSGVHKLIKIREHTIEYLLWGISTADEVEFSNSRIALAKITTLITIFDDLFDDYASIDQIKAIKEAVLQGWNVSLLQNIPNDFKESLLFVFKTIHELAITAAIRQGRDMMPHITKAWEDYITTNLQQAQWRVCGVVPNFKDYMKNASISVAFGPILLHSLISVAPVLTDEIIEKIYLSKSKFYDLIAFSSRLVDDTRDYEEEKLHGQTASAISSYMEDNPEFTEDEAINHINNLIDISLKELTWEFLNPRNELLYCEKICFNISRGTQFFYIFGDGFTHSDKEIKDQIFKVLIEPVKIPIKIELLSSN